MEYIENLERYLERTDGRKIILTGTFDPPHRGHVSAIEDAMTALDDVHSAVVVPHSWSVTKSPVMPLSDRFRAVGLTFEQFGAQIGCPVVVSQDFRVSTSVDEFIAVTSRFVDQLVRAVGCDEKILIEKLNASGWSVVEGVRCDTVSSSAIKKMLAENSSVPELTELVHRDVLLQLGFGEV